MWTQLSDDVVGRKRPMWVIVVTWIMAASVALGVAIRLFGLDYGVLLVQLAAFTPYLIAGAVLVAGLAGFTRQWRALGVAGLTVVLLLLIILPRAFANDPPTTGTPVSIMSSNMLIGAADATALVDLVREAKVDVLALQEYTPRAEQNLLAAGLGTLLPYRETHPGNGPRGSAIYSKLPLTDGGVRLDAGARSTEPITYNQAYGTVIVAGRPLIIESVHPVPPLDGEQTQRWAAGLRFQIRGDAAGPGRILVGDFNATVDHHELRDLLATGYHDAAGEVGEGLTGTWPYYGERAFVTPRIALDHVLVPAGVGVRDFRAVTIPHTDHRAVICTLVV